jgi:hypothetical protein
VLLVFELAGVTLDMHVLPETRRSYSFVRVDLLTAWLLPPSRSRNQGFVVVESQYLEVGQFQIRSSLPLKNIVTHPRLNSSVQWKGNS